MISMIVAHDINLVIGLNNQMPWHYSKDLKYFKKTTLNQTILMGSSTLQSIIDHLGHPLPNRTTILLTSKNETDHNVSIVNSVEEVLKQYQNSKEELIVCGGASIYKQFLPYANKMYITHINKEYEGDTYFPSYDLFNWIKTSENIDGLLNFSIYERKN